MGLRDFQGHTLGICVSGGLDSRTVTRRLLDAGCSLVCFTADLGQPDEQDIGDVQRRMEAVGAESVIVDLKPQMAEACFATIKALAQYDGGYWNTTGIARAVTVRGLLPAMQARGCTVLVHGATGRGNDQIRFERYTNVLAPSMQVYAPWRDPTMLAQFPGRAQMVAYLQQLGLEATLVRKRYSTDANLAGLSHEAEDLEDVETSCLIVDPVMCVWPQRAPDHLESVTLQFERGRCVAIDGAFASPLELMQRANAIGGRHGLGLANALENRIIGTKSRGVYEAPGMELLATGLRAIYQSVLDRRATALFGQMSRLVADATYDGRLFDPAARAALACIDVLAEPASGTVELGLYKGNAFVQAIRGVAATLYNPADASMEASDGLDPRSSQGFVEVLRAEAVALARA
ncbi:MAG: argininosuccinate synthase, partial [Nannocystaceae bacterium]|nr:argininosuccinate synthase [Nannocystaceae bacterium]